MIHPSASIHDDARLAEDVQIGSNAVVEEDVVVGAGTVIGAGTILHAGSRVGANCRLGPYAVLAGTPLDTSFAGERSFAVLEDDVHLREFATVHRATGEAAETRVGAGSLVMCYVHISHNCKVGRGVVLTTSTQMGGHCEVGDYAFVGSTTLLHQFCRVGAYAMYGAGSATNQDILPFATARGNPARHLRLNKVGLERRGITGERYQHIERALRALRRKDDALLNELAAQSEDVKGMLEFIQDSKRGICKFV